VGASARPRVPRALLSHRSLGSAASGDGSGGDKGGSGDGGGGGGVKRGGQSAAVKGTGAKAGTEGRQGKAASHLSDAEKLEGVSLRVFVRVLQMCDVRCVRVLFAVVARWTACQHHRIFRHTHTLTHTPQLSTCTPPSQLLGRSPASTHALTFSIRPCSRFQGRVWRSGSEHPRCAQGNVRGGRAINTSREPESSERWQGERCWRRRWWW
jgi:hypothetical protein